MARVLITGVNGFVGRYLADYCISKGDEVHGITKTSRADVKDVRIHICDIRDGDAIVEVISAIKPERIYHLAAITFIPEVDRNPKLTYDTNFYGSLNLYEAVRRLNLKSKILFFVCSDFAYQIAEIEKGMREAIIKVGNLDIY